MFMLLVNVQILLFNCMSVRDPKLLLPRLVHACASHGKYQSCLGLFGAAKSIE